MQKLENNTAVYIKMSSIRNVCWNKKNAVKIKSGFNSHQTSTRQNFKSAEAR